MYRMTKGIESTSGDRDEDIYILKLQYDAAVQRREIENLDTGCGQ